MENVQDDRQVSNSNPFSAYTILAIFCSLNLLNFLERGAIASNGVNGSPATVPPCPPDGCSSGSGIQAEFGLSNYADGLLASSFLVGLLVASPLFAHASKSRSPFHLIVIGLSTWALAVVAGALAPTFSILVVARMFVGVGEASFVILAMPIIDDIAPADKRASWIATFYLCIPCGFALGYVVGGLCGPFLGWRGTFLLEAVLMVPFILLFACSPSSSFHRPSLTPEAKREQDKSSDEVVTLMHPDHVPASEAASSQGSQLSSDQCEDHRSELTSQTSLISDISCLFRNPTYTSNALASAAYTFVVGSFAYWGPKAAATLFLLPSTDAVFGLITLLTGVCGTLAGGFALDRLGSSTTNALRLQALVTLAACVLLIASFLSPSMPAFFVLLAAGQFFLFSAGGPMNLVCMQAAPHHLRSLAIATGTVLLHLLGDVPSPPLLGALQDALGNWRASMSLLSLVLLLATGIWAQASWRVARQEGEHEGLMEQVT